jgi:5-formyltetrahydrofolate cyclo-ligase
MTLDKSLLRSQLREARAKISPAEAEQAARSVVARALPLLDVLLSETGSAPDETPVALYAALPGELDSFPLLEALAARGFPTLLPVAGAKATPLTFRLWRPGDDLVSGRFGLREPAPGAPERVPRILFAPLLGFDGQGGRLGFGGGYYDATLARLRREKTVTAGGLAFSLQRVEAIPHEKHDEKLDFVITEAALFRFSQSSLPTG